MIADEIKIAMLRDALIVIPWHVGSGFKALSLFGVEALGVNAVSAHSIDNLMEAYCGDRLDYANNGR